MLLTAKGVLTFGELEGLPLHVYMVGWDEEVLTGTLSSNWVKWKPSPATGLKLKWKPSPATVSISA